MRFECRPLLFVGGHNAPIVSAKPTQSLTAPAERPLIKNLESAKYITMIGTPINIDPAAKRAGFGDGIEKAFLRHIPHRRTGGVDQDESPMAVDEIELRHEKIHRRHCHEGREHPQNERRFHERFATLEPITGHTVCREDGQCRSEQAAHRGNEQRIAEPSRIIIQRRIRKQLLKAVEAVLRREKAVEGIQRARPRKRCQKQPQDGKEEHQTDRQYDWETAHRLPKRPPT